MITYTIVTSEKDEVKKETPNDALINIKTLAKDSSKWIYLDGVLTDADDLTESKLEQCNNITLTNMLMGG